MRDIGMFFVTPDLCHVGCARMAGHPSLIKILFLCVVGEIARGFLTFSYSPGSPLPACVSKYAYALFRCSTTRLQLLPVDNPSPLLEQPRQPSARQPDLNALWNFFSPYCMNILRNLGKQMLLLLQEAFECWSSGSILMLLRLEC